MPSWQVRWRVKGRREENRVEAGKALMRNPFHFTEGFGNPDDPERVIVRAGQGEPTWAAGGTCQVVRTIRMADRPVGPGLGGRTGEDHGAAA
ncbi:hypothetical protein ACLIYP_15520 [Streptomyces nanhaiensis]|uniref:hypothetical protein n=1 Tax=Streptomyces nanhaiensis TaxID=679319 RepID=UPI00399C9736